MYNQVEVTVFQRYFISWGIALDIVNEIPLLYFVCLDGCHLKILLEEFVWLLLFHSAIPRFFLLLGL